MSVIVGSEEGPFGLKSILATAFPLVLIVRSSVPETLPETLPEEVSMERKSVPAMEPPLVLMERRSVCAG